MDRQHNGSGTRAHSSYRSYSARQRVLGPAAARVPPAWKHGTAPYQRPRPASFFNDLEPANLGGGYMNLPQQEGSKIYISHLPADVDDLDIQQLLSETIGPLIYGFVVFDAHGSTRMAAVASFVDPTHAAKAVELYNGKVIDGKEPIRVEQVGINPKARQPVSAAGTSNSRPGSKVHGPAASNSLLNRISKPVSTPKSLLARISGRPIVATPPKKSIPPPPTSTAASHVPSRPKKFVKKGPKRLQKTTQLQQLEKDMDQYRSSAPTGLGLQ